MRNVVNGDVGAVPAVARFYKVSTDGSFLQFDWLTNCPANDC